MKDKVTFWLRGAKPEQLQQVVKELDNETNIMLRDILIDKCVEQEQFPYEDCSKERGEVMKDIQKKSNDFGHNFIEGVTRELDQLDKELNKKIQIMMLLMSLSSH